MVKELDSTKQMLNKLAKDYQSLEKKIEQRPVVQQQAETKTDKPPVQKAAFSLRTPPGKRAITLSIKSLAAVGGLINAGDFVDIIAHLNIPGEETDKKATTEKLTTVLFQNLQVLAVNTNYNPVGQEPAYETQQQMGALNVTLAVSPEEAGLLSFAQSNGDLQLSLRSPVDKEGNVLQKVASWTSLADFVLERQGTELHIPIKREAPKTSAGDEEEEIEEVRPSIQIFRGGREL